MSILLAKPQVLAHGLDDKREGRQIPTSLQTSIIQVGLLPQLRPINETFPQNIKGIQT